MKLNLKLTSLLLGTCVLAGPSASAMDPHDHSDDGKAKKFMITGAIESAVLGEKHIEDMGGDSAHHLITFDFWDDRAYAELLQNVYERGITGIMIVGSSIKKVPDLKLSEILYSRGGRELNVEICGCELTARNPIYSTYELKLRQITSPGSEPRSVTVLVYRNWDLVSDNPIDLGGLERVCNYFTCQHNKSVICHPNSSRPLSIHLSSHILLSEVPDDRS